MAAAAARTATETRWTRMMRIKAANSVDKGNRKALVTAPPRRGDEPSARGEKQRLCCAVLLSGFSGPSAAIYALPGTPTIPTLNQFSRITLP